MDNGRPDPNDTDGYRLSLSRDLNWNLVSDSALRGWLGRLTSIMELEPGTDDRYPFISFTAGEKAGNRERPPGAQPDNTEPLPVFDWRSVRMYYRSSGDVAIEVYNDGDADLETINMSSAMFPVYRKVVEDGGFAIHAGLSELEGKGILFAGAGGAGKSTCCRRLPVHWKRLCDDLSLILRHKDGGYHVHPLPTWSEYFGGRDGGNTWNAGYASPLRAIFFLARSDRDEIIPIESRSKAALRTHESAFQSYRWFCNAMEGEHKWGITRRIFENACDMAQVIPAYVLRVSLTGNFWEMIEGVCL